MIAIVANLKVKAGQEAAFEKAATALAQSVRADEPGNKLYTLCRGQTVGEYTFLERYDDEAAVAAHRASAHYKSRSREMGAFLDGAPTVTVLTEV